MKSIATSADMKLTGRLLRYTAPENLPLSFVYGGRKISGIPAEFSPAVETRWLDASMLQYIICGQDSNGLEIRVEYVEYLDYPGTEFLAFFTNRGNADTALISDIKIVDGVLPWENATLYHGNGDTCRENGYEWEYEKADHPIHKETVDGTSCNGAFPYMRLMNGESGVNIGVGWPVSWQADFAPVSGGVQVSIGQRRCKTVIHPGETLRTPRVNFVAYTGDEFRGMNMWRRWYFEHILPRENGQPLPPKLCLHVFKADDKPEFTGANEQNQCDGLQEYIDKGLKPDIWWFDAGWYPCNYDWPAIGDWRPDPARFPNGLTPLGQKCEENDVQLMLWFEPERAREGTPLATEHPEWMLRAHQDDGALSPNCLVNLGDDACCDYIIDLIDGIIKDSHVHIYRQDFNFSPRRYWEENEAEDRIGALENHHAQGYLRYWDTLRLRNPGMWMDSCASGGRRNDLETMRRAVPLHYTDVGYGHHPIKQKQHFQMFQWIPYFRAHNMSWDDPQTGEYTYYEGRTPDRFAFHCAMVPSMTDLIEHDASEEAFALSREMREIWFRAAQLMLGGDYYPLTPCRKSAEDYYAVEFYDPDEKKGYLQVIRNNRVQEPSYTACLKALEDETVYVVTEAETGAAQECTGKALRDGFTVELPIRSGKVFFFEAK